MNYSGGMEFCDECGGMLVPEKESGETSFTCRNCGLEADGDGEPMNITETKQNNEDGLIGEEDTESLPETDAECDECGNDTAYYYLQQTRAADESETRFYICMKCGNKWRDYD